MRFGPIATQPDCHCTGAFRDVSSAARPVRDAKSIRFTARGKVAIPSGKLIRAPDAVTNVLRQSIWQRLHPFLH